MTGYYPVGEFRGQRVDDCSSTVNCGIAVEHGLGADCAARTIAEMNNDVIYTDLGHGEGFVHRRAECLGEQSHPRCHSQHSDLAREAHSGLFQIATEVAVD